VKIERWICDICYRCENEPWHGKQYFTEEGEVAHVLEAHKWIQKCVELPDGSDIVLRFFHDINEFHAALLTANNSKGNRFMAVTDIQNISPFKGPGWYFFSNPDQENPESTWKLAHITDMRDVADKSVERMEQAMERARLARQEVYTWVGKENEPVAMPPEWPVSEEEAAPLPVLP
jgi:hypothetical protein